MSNKPFLGTWFPENLNHFLDHELKLSRDFHRMPSFSSLEFELGILISPAQTEPLRGPDVQVLLYKLPKRMIWTKTRTGALQADKFDPEPTAEQSPGIKSRSVDLMSKPSL